MTTPSGEHRHRIPRIRLHEREERELAAYQRSLLDTHHHEVDAMYTRMRVWRHDYRNHLQTLKTLAAQGDLDALRRYLDELDDQLTTLDSPIRSGNAMADAILSSKMALAQSQSIDVRVDARIPVRLRIGELDLCAVIGNLFDNAIEATRDLPDGERLIRVYMDMKGTQLYISFTNTSASAKLGKVRGRFASTKHGAGHGFGLLSVDRIVEAAGGYLSRNSEDGAFTTEILLPQE